MPSVKKGETEEQYVKRAIPFIIKNEGLPRREAVAKAFGMWRQHQKK